MKRGSLAATSASILIAFAPAAPVPTHLMQAPAYYFPTEVGTKWVLTDGDRKTQEEVTSVRIDATGARIVTVQRTTGNKLDDYPYRVAVSEKGMQRIEADGQAEEENWWLRLPDKAGLEWRITSPRTHASTQGRESVEVLGKSHEAIVVELWNSPVSQLGAGSPNPITKWFVPGMGMVRYEVGDHTGVMTSFTRPVRKP